MTQTTVDFLTLEYCTDKLPRKVVKNYNYKLLIMSGERKCEQHTSDLNVHKILHSTHQNKFTSVFCMDLRINRNNFPLQRQLIGFFFYNRNGLSLLRGTN